MSEYCWHFLRNRVCKWNARFFMADHIFRFISNCFEFFSLSLECDFTVIRCKGFGYRETVHLWCVNIYNCRHDDYTPHLFYICENDFHLLLHSNSLIHALALVPSSINWMFDALKISWCFQMNSFWNSMLKCLHPIRRLVWKNMSI